MDDNRCNAVVTLRDGEEGQEGLICLPPLESGKSSLQPYRRRKPLLSLLVSCLQLDPIAEGRSMRM